MEENISSAYEDRLLVPTADEEEENGLLHHQEPLFPSFSRFSKWSHKNQQQCLMCFGFSLLLSLLLAIALPLFITAQVDHGIKEDVVIDSPDVDGYEQFLNQSKDGNNFVEFYFFNLTNPHQVLKGEKPHVEQLGPFCYTFSTIRSDLQWDKEQDHLFYHEHTYYVFNKQMTLEKTNSRFGSDDIPITSLNLIFGGAKALVGEKLWPLVSDLLFGFSLFNKLFTTKKVVEFIKGYSVYLFDIIPIPLFPGLYPNNSRVTYTMRVGEKDWSKAYEIVTWNGMKDEIQTDCPFVGEKYCDAPCCKPLIGSNRVPIWQNTLYPGEFDEYPNNLSAWKSHNGEQFQPKLKKRAKLIIFNEVVQRPLLFNFNKKTSYKGIKLWRFTPDPLMFANASERPANERYYMTNTPKGMLSNLSLVEQGVDVYASLPHFLHGQESLHNGVNGLSPEEEAHSMFIEVEPTLGQTMVQHVRAQINGRFSKEVLEKYFPKGIKDNTYVPMAWFDQVSLINQEGIDEFNQIPTAYAIRKGAIIAGSILSILCALPLLYAFRVYRNNKRVPEGYSD